MSQDNAGNPAQPFWQVLYPFEYWDNRISKINRYNPEDRLEALFLTMQLADLYTHIFVAKVRNPLQPWFILKEQTDGWDIRDTLDKLTVEYDGLEQILVGELVDKPEGLMSYNIVAEDWDVDLYDLIAADFLGCPAKFNPEKKEVEFLEEPALHYGTTNAILNFSQENRALLNDFKHGFRVLPFDYWHLDGMAQMDQLENPEAIEEFKEQIESLQDQWVLHFLRMSTAEAEDEDVWYDYEVTLDIHRAHIGACVAFAELTLYKLINLFGRGGEYFIEPYLEELYSQANVEDDALTIIESLGELRLEFNPDVEQTLGKEHN